MGGGEMWQVVSGGFETWNFHWSLRGLARSHRDTSAIRPCAIPVGAGAPAKRPAQTAKISMQPLAAHQLRQLGGIRPFDNAALGHDHVD
ncbi:hypothetical protein C6A77_03365 [Pseudomonas sp. AFG_SD02_1510_Pfu_092]|nr:hypothetical protein C6A77_03365 [Pseudomonas sp. AFG_SD02_1510_Pfu_092]